MATPRKRMNKRGGGARKVGKSRPAPRQRAKAVKATNRARVKAVPKGAMGRPERQPPKAKETRERGGQEAITQKLKRFEQGEDMTMGRRARSNVSIPDPETVKDAVDTLVANDSAMEYLKKNVSKRSLEVLGMLVTPKTDEYLAEKLEMKINAIRRILNIMQGYGITNYYISKNTNGWLSFSWYINTSKLQPFLDYINNMERESAVVNENCNDYFICGDCYKSDKIIYPFEAAFENNFRCNCGNKLDRMDSSEVSVMLNKRSAPTQEQTQI